MTDPRPSCPKCQAEQSDWMLCPSCVNHLTRDLKALPGLYHQLQITITGQGKTTEGGKSNERHMPYKEKASKLADTIKKDLAKYVTELDMGDTQHLANNTRAHALWLADRTQRIRSHTASHTIATTIEQHTKQINYTIDLPRDSIFCGTCDTCGQALYATEGQTTGVCQHCRAAGVKTTYDPDANRADMLSRVGHQWKTVAVCAMVLAPFGVEVKAETIQNWARGDTPRLVKRGQDSGGHALYRVGDVEELARAGHAKAMEKLAKRKAG